MPEKPMTTSNLRAPQEIKSKQGLREGTYINLCTNFISQKLRKDFLNYQGKDQEILYKSGKLWYAQ